MLVVAGDLYAPSWTGAGLLPTGATCSAKGKDGSRLSGYAMEAVIIIDWPPLKGWATRPKAVSPGPQNHESLWRTVAIFGILLASGVLGEDGAQLVFKEDHTFKTPSGAAVTLLGRPANGWKKWKSKFGGTLDEFKRQITGNTAERDS